MDERQRLKELLLQKSYRQGTFTLTSGKTSDFYVDGKQTTTLTPRVGICAVGFSLISSPAPGTDHRGRRPMTLGADPLVTAVSLVSYLEKAPLPAFIVRKEAKGHGSAILLRAKTILVPGGLVALVEDVVTTGGTLLKVIERVENEGFKVGLVLTVVDRQEGGAETLAAAGYPLRPSSP
jgi:orotate phosphoribosyltransferase